MSARYAYRPDSRGTGFVIYDTLTGEGFDTARNEARARLLVVRYNREASDAPR